MWGQMVLTLIVGIITQYTNLESLGCTLETNIMLYALVSLKKIKKHVQLYCSNSFSKFLPLFVHIIS